MAERSWDTGEYLLWLNNTEQPHFGSHAIVGGLLGMDDHLIGLAVLAVYPPRAFSASIDPAKVDPAEVGRELREDHAELGYGPRGDDYALDVVEDAEALAQLRAKLRAWSLDDRIREEVAKAPRISVERASEIADLLVSTYPPARKRPAPGTKPPEPSARCYSDHDEDIRVKGSCDYCGGVNRD